MAFYFTLRRVIHRAVPLLTFNIFMLELWQIIAGLLFIGVGIYFTLYCGRVITNTLQRFPFLQQPTDSDSNSKFGYPCMLIILGSLWSNGFVLLGIPDYLFTLVRTVSHSLIVAGGIWLALSAVNELQRILLSKAQSTDTVLDDILVTLVGSLMKLILFITGAIMFAEIYSIPYETMIAGLGIGGLAFAIAARDTIANFFGSAVILADRPFSPGDKISIGDHIGFIESVGLRSTKIRTEDESVVIIPNNMVSQDIISNQTRKQRSLVDLHLNLANNTSAAAIADASEAIATMLKQQDEVDGKWLFVGAAGFHRCGIILRVRCYLTLTIERDFLIARHRLTMNISELVEQHGIAMDQPAGEH
jgi:MscS family membrane protein